MRPLGLLGGFLILFSTAAISNTVFLRTVEIPEQQYRKISDVVLSASDDSVESMTFEFLDKAGLPAKEKITRRILPTELNACSSYPCAIDLFKMPLAFQKGTCEVRVSGGHSQRFKWGDCEKLPAKPSEIFLSDLAFNRDPVSDTVEVVNEGYGLKALPLSVLAYVEDRNGAIIWNDKKTTVVTLAEGELHHHNFHLAPKAWQKRLGCRMHVTLDPDCLLPEKKKKNNDLTISFGYCEPTPNVDAGDLYDFRPLISDAQDHIAVSVVNEGRLPLVKDHEILQVAVRTILVDGTEEFYRLERRGPLHGFGDSMEFLQIPREGVCSIHVTANTEQLLRESSHENNKTSLHLCNQRFP